MDKTAERITWLRYEFVQLLEQFQNGLTSASQLAQSCTALTTQTEVDTLQDDLLQHSFWAIQHMTHRPACWAPKPEEISYLLRCLRDEEIFDPEQLDFQTSHNG